MQVSPLTTSRGLPMQSRTLSNFGRLRRNNKEWTCFRAVKESARGTERFELTISSEDLAGWVPSGIIVNFYSCLHRIL